MESIDKRIYTSRRWIVFWAIFSVSTIALFLGKIDGSQFATLLGLAGVAYNGARAVEHMKQ